MSGRLQVAQQASIALLGGAGAGAQSQLIPALYQNIGKCQEPLGYQQSHETRFSNELDLVRDIQGHPGNMVSRTENHSDGDDPGYWVAGFAKAVRFDGLLDYHGLAKVHNTSPLKQIFN